MSLAFTAQCFGAITMRCTHYQNDIGPLHQLWCQGLRTVAVEINALFQRHKQCAVRCRRSMVCICSSAAHGHTRYVTLRNQCTGDAFGEWTTAGVTRADKKNVQRSVRLSGIADKVGHAIAQLGGRVNAGANHARATTRAIHHG